MARRDQRSDLKRYLASLLLVLAAAAVTIAVKPLFAGKAPLVFFTISVILSAAYGGMGAGLLATMLSLGIAFSLFQDRVFPLVMAQSSLTLFAVIGIAIAIVVGKLRGLNAALMDSREELRAANKELSLANQRLSQQGEALSNSNEELQRFAYGLAHDLHNPLRSIGALTDLLLGRNADKFDESSRECARMIVDGVNRMGSMIRSLLDYAAAAESNEGPLVVTDCNRVVEQVLRDLKYLIETSGTLVKVEPLPAVSVNADHLMQVFSNLIGNAVKYRNALKPEVHISAREEEDDWRFAVKDNGIGLDMQYADNIFGMFKRLHTSKHYEGSGVGLALCKVIILRNGGRIWVESELGKGSTFFFTLPKVGEQRQEQNTLTLKSAR
jgi:signal transduction histidine kinase